jgi:hypothetical protein
LETTTASYATRRLCLDKASTFVIRPAPASFLRAAWRLADILLISGQCAPHAEYRGRFLPKPFLSETLSRPGFALTGGSQD